MTAEAAQPPLRPLPIRPGPVSGESTFSYIRRLAVANHLRPMHLRRYLTDPGPGVTTTVRREQGMVHNFMLWDTISPACAAAADRVAADLAASLRQQDS